MADDDPENKMAKPFNKFKNDFMVLTTKSLT